MSTLYPLTGVRSVLSVRRKGKVARGSMPPSSEPRRAMLSIIAALTASLDKGKLRARGEVEKAGDRTRPQSARDPREGANREGFFCNPFGLHRQMTIWPTTPEKALTKFALCVHTDEPGDEQLDDRDDMASTRRISAQLKRGTNGEAGKWRGREHGTHRGGRMWPW